MKSRGLKIALIIILSIIIIVLINFMVYAIVNKDLKTSLISFGDNTEMIFEKEYNPEQLESLDIDVSSSNVKIEKTDTENIKIIAYGDKNDKIKELIDNDELVISKENSRRFIFAMFYWCNEEITIQIPKDSNEELKVNTSSGDIIAKNLENNDIKFETSSGEIVCENINNGELKSSSGDITVGNGNEVVLNSSSGSIKY